MSNCQKKTFHMNGGLLHVSNLDRRALNEFIRSTPLARGKVDPVVSQFSIPSKEDAPCTRRYYGQKRERVR